MTTSKAQNQALRQLAALTENGLTARREVPTPTQTNRTNHLFGKLEYRQYYSIRGAAMNDGIMLTLAELLVEQHYQFEAGYDDEVNEDFSVKIVEQAAARLQSLDADATQAFLKVVGAMIENTNY